MRAFARQYETSRELLRKQLGAAARPLLAILDAEDEEVSLQAIEKSLIAAFRGWATHVKGVDDFVAARFYFAGQEVAPYVPSACWSTGYAGEPFEGTRGKPRAVLFREAPGFDPHPLPALCDAADEDDALIPDDAPTRLVLAPFVARSLDWAARALESAVKDPAFAALAPRRPFHFLVTPGHDEPEVLLLAV